MRIKMSISRKMIFYILSTSILIYCGAVGYIGYYARMAATSEIKEVTNSIAMQYAYKIKASLDGDVDVAKTLSHVGENYKSIPYKQFLKVFLDAQHTLMINHLDYLSVATSWEIRYIDSTWNKTYGRKLSGYYREGAEIKYMYKELNLDGDVIGSNYHNLKLSGQSSMFDPEFYSYTGKKEDEQISTNISIPIMVNNNFIGLAGIDIDMKKFKDLIAEIKPFEGSYSFLLSNTGCIVAHPNSQITGQFFDKSFPELNAKHFVLDQVRVGKQFSFDYLDKKTGKSFYFAYAPILFNELKTPWSVSIVVPGSVINAHGNKAFLIASIVGVIGMILLGLVIYLISKNITRPLLKTTYVLQQLAQGKIDHSQKLEVKTKDELGQMAESVNTLMEGLDRTALFAREIGEGNLNANYDLLSSDDTIGNSLLEMRKSLVKAADEERKRKEEDEKQKWITSGINQMGEILRQNTNDLRKLSSEIMIHLIDYLNATLGAIYILNDHESDRIFYEMTAAIAYGRNRTTGKEILPGEGMVGRCAYEKASIYMTDVPKEYIRITSGLGTANPTNLLLVPLKLNDNVLGVIEIATFKKLELHMIEFVERIAESIASTVSSVKINEKTAFLLRQSQEQADMLSQQEEEMRQNMEEMHATQEETSKREAEMKAVIDSIYDISLVAEFDMEGTIININDNFLEFFGATRDQMLGKKQGSFSAQKDNDMDYYEFWSDLKDGNTRKKIQQITTNYGDRKWISEIYAPIPDVHGVPHKVINIAVDITDSMNSKNNL